MWSDSTLMHSLAGHHAQSQTPWRCCLGIGLQDRDVLLHGRRGHHGRRHYVSHGHRGRHGRRHRVSHGHRGHHGHHGRRDHDLLDWYLLRGMLRFEPLFQDEFLTDLLGPRKIAECLIPYRLQQVVRTSH